MKICWWIPPLCSKRSSGGDDARPRHRQERVRFEALSWAGARWALPSPAPVWDPWGPTTAPLRAVSRGSPGECSLLCHEPCVPGSRSLGPALLKRGQEMSRGYLSACRIDGGESGRGGGWADGTQFRQLLQREKAVRLTASTSPDRPPPSPLAPSSPGGHSGGLSHLPRHLPGRGAGGGHSGGALRRQPGHAPSGSTQRRRALWRLGSRTTTTTPEPDGGGSLRGLGDHCLLGGERPCFSPRHSPDGWSWHSGRSR